MAATPQYGSMTFMGMQTKKTYSKDIYLSDVNAGAINWDDAGAGASSTSETFWTAPEDVILVDYAQVTGTADTEKLGMTRDGLYTGDVLRYTIHLTSLNNRPRLQVGFKRGTKIGAKQISD